MNGEFRYNPWPLGKLPKEFRRPEPDLIRSHGYEWEDPREIVEIFERKLAEFSNSRYCVLVDCASNALFLCLTYIGVHGKLLKIPRHTYVSVPMQIIHSGGQIKLIEEFWTGIYQLVGTPIFDGSGRFCPDMYVGSGSLHVLSFQIKKRIPIGRGGAILTDDINAYQWLKKAAYDGRDLKTDYQLPDHVSQIGWHFYMTPEDAARGILLMDSIKEYSDFMSWRNYPPIDQFSFFQNMQIFPKAGGKFN